jgi:hypothetical protein
VTLEHYWTNRGKSHVDNNMTPPLSIPSLFPWYIQRRKTSKRDDILDDDFSFIFVKSSKKNSHLAAYLVSSSVFKSFHACMTDHPTLCQNHFPFYLVIQSQTNVIANQPLIPTHRFVLIVKMRCPKVNIMNGW